jgi:hypothetical protein
VKPIESLLGHLVLHETELYGVLLLGVAMRLVGAARLVAPICRLRAEWRRANAVIDEVRSDFPAFEPSNRDLMAVAEHVDGREYRS